MNHSFVTAAIEISHPDEVERHLAQVNAAARQKLNVLQGPAAFLHFLSMNVIRHQGAKRPHLVLEAAVDGNDPEGLRRIADVLKDELRSVLTTAGLSDRISDLPGFLEKHRIRIGSGWFATPGVVFAGAPGLSVDRIRKEAGLAKRVADLLDANHVPCSARHRLEQVRQAIFEDAHFKWAFVPEAVPLLGDQPEQRNWPLARSFLGHYAWPLLIPLALASLFAVRSWQMALVALLLTLAAELVIVAAIVLLQYKKVRRDEDHHPPRDGTPDAKRFEQIMERENWIAQNHLAGVSCIKPRRRLTLRLVLWLVHAISKHHGKPGFLSGIGGIYFARWMHLPGTDKLLFFANYEGSWMNYLEDFIARAHKGLSAVWSNTQDFPQTHRLINGGASDGVRFKRWARRQQQPTYFWYSAYPGISLTHIRSNAAIRHGFATAATEAQAARWLEHFGIRPPPCPVESHEVPTLAFGGLPKLRYACCLLIRLEGTVEDCCRWLKAIEPSLCYGEHSMTCTASVVGLCATALNKLGVDEHALGTFPPVFRNGMTAASRLRVLGDEQMERSQQWLWGTQNTSVDAILMVYAESDKALQDEVMNHRQLITQYGHTPVTAISLDPLPPKGQPIREPFGFVDGISQPAMRGTRSAQRRAPHHIVEPGELVLGYANNLGYIAPTPRCAGFDIGRNGTFLVVRQLEQDTTEFGNYLKMEATAMIGSARAPASTLKQMEEWIAAKMVGRWRADGSSLIEYPHAPAAVSGQSVAPDNDFLFGEQDPHGLRCPLGAHIRRANPRDSFDPGSPIQLAITNRHRILRVGRSYPASVENNPGLLFMCINTDIEAQFEFVQQSWLQGRSFHGLRDESDPTISLGPGGGHNPMSIPTPHGPLRLKCLPDFVSTRGGGYFFLPSRGAVAFLVRHCV